MPLNATGEGWREGHRCREGSEDTLVNGGRGTMSLAVLAPIRQNAFCV